MAKVKVFLSFEFDRDKELYPNFYTLAARGDSCHEIEDYSLKETRRPHDDKWLKEAEMQISRSDIVIVVLGQDTHSASGVEQEVKLAKKHGKPIFQIRPEKRTSGGVPEAGKVIPWDWKKIDAKISECLKK